MGITAAYMLPHPPLIVPQIGRGEEQKIASTIKGYHDAAKELAAHAPDTIVLISPHQVMYADYFHISPGSGAKGDFSQFRAPQVRMEVSYDTEFVSRLCEYAKQAGLPAGTQGERDKRLDHGTMVPLYFVNQYWKDYKLVRIGLSGMPLSMHYQLGQCIQKTAEAFDKNVVIIASGDLSHRLKADGPYGYQKEGPAYDKRIMDVMRRAAFSKLLEFSDGFCEKAGECGHRSFTIMAGALDALKAFHLSDQAQVIGRQLSYEGPFGVGYGICTYKVQQNGERSQ